MEKKLDQRPPRPEDMENLGKLKYEILIKLQQNFFCQMQ